MKKGIPLFIVFWCLFTSFSINSQTLPNNLPSGKLTNDGATFYKIQKAYNDHFNALKVEDGYYLKDGKKTKIAGWKQYKRWEWYWENRVDPVTGEFPKSSAAEIRQQLKRSNGIRNADGNWLSLGPSSSDGGYAGIGRLNCVAFVDGDESRLYVGSPSGGLWKTTDGGVSWEAMTDDNDVLGVSDIIVFPAPSPMDDTIYIATGDRDGGSMSSLGGDQKNDNNTIGVLVSADGGMTWTDTDLAWLPSDKKTVNRLLKHPAGRDTIYASGTDGVFKTTDGGLTWPIISGVAEFVDMEFNPTVPEVMYGSTRTGEVYTSDDGGLTWLKTLDVPGGVRVELAVSMDETDWVYAVVSKPGGGLDGVYKSIDAGGIFTKIFDGTVPGGHLLGYYCDGSIDGGQGSYDLCIAADPSDATTVFLGGVNTWVSIDGGLSWSPSNMWAPDPDYNFCGSPVVHADKHYLAFAPGTSTLYECNDGGIYKTADGGSTWEDIGNGLVISQLYRLGVSQTSSVDVIAGLQDNGTKSLSGSKWKDVIGGDGMECFIDYTDNDIQYGELYYGSLVRTKDKWASSSSITAGLSGSAAWVTPFVIDPTTAETIYVALDTVWKSTDQGDTWSKISAFSTGGKTFRSLAIAPSSSDTIYAATKEKLYATFDGGASWSDKTGLLPTGSSNITYISVNHDYGDTLWVSMGEYNGFGVYQSTDAGATWADISSGLPMIPIMSVVQNRQNTTEIELYAGTDVGVYVKVGAADWAEYDAGLPNVVVTELDIFYNDASPNLSRIRAATYGRGLWESELYSPAGSLPVAGFMADNLTPLADSAVVFTDLTINDPDTWLWSFTPSTVTYLSGTGSGSQHPEVSFDAGGDYTVELTASSTFGSDTETKIDYITVESPYVWKGSSSSDWSASANWENAAVPDHTKHVIIPTGATFYPELTGGNIHIDDDSGFYNCKSLLIESGGSFTVGSDGSPLPDMLVYGNLTIETGGTLSLSDDLDIKSGGKLYITGGTVKNHVNYGGFGDIIFRVGSGGYMTGGTLTVYSDLWFLGGTWNATGGTLHCGGTGSPVKILTYDGDLFLNDFTIDAGVKDSIDAFSTVALSIHGDYTQEVGSSLSIPLGDEVSVSGDVLLKSDATGNASLLNEGAFTVSGTSSIERYIPAYTSGSDGWHLVSSPTDAMAISGSDFDPGSGDDLYEWDEATNTWLNYKNGHFTEFESGFGYLTAFELTTTASFTGTLNGSDITHTDLSLGSGSGWHILGNPFPTAIEWGTADWAISSISATSQVWNDVGGNYLALVAKEIIPSTNGFFVQASSGTNSITIPTAARVLSTENNYKKNTKSGIEETLRLTITNDENTYYDVNRVGFKTDATDAWDVEYDAHKLYGVSAAPQLWTVSNEENFTINYLPYSLETVEVPLHFRAGVNSTYHIEAEGVESFYQSDDIFLEDLQKDVLINLREKPLYDFLATTEDAESRFLLHFYGVTSTSEQIDAENVHIYSFNNTVYIRFKKPPSDPHTVEVFDNYGKIIYKGYDISNTLNTIRLDVLQGLYIVRLTGDKFSKNQKVIIN